MFTVPGDITRCVLGSRLPNIRVLRPRKPPERNCFWPFAWVSGKLVPEEDVHSTRRYHQVRPRLSPTQYSCSPDLENPPRNCFWPFAWGSGKLVLKKMFTVPGDITRCVLGSRLPNIRVLRPRKPPEKLLLAFRMGIRQVGPEEDVHSTRRYHQVRPTLSPTRYSCSPTSKTPGNNSGLICTIT
ncbi:unnamed protein product [Trichogramma brassicae]|uniref:Uncharacterized protein n=1 Tax=Trichogramma brassicae TaxID=86971 RepID=A0A6H5II91_9HYME|nr:unnamed protein product [Trichogramma brassicae]